MDMFITIEGTVMQSVWVVSFGNMHQLSRMWKWNWWTLEDGEREMDFRKPDFKQDNPGVSTDSPHLPIILFRHPSQPSKSTVFIEFLCVSDIDMPDISDVWDIETKNKLLPHWSYNIVGRALALCIADPGLIPGILYGPLISTSCSFWVELQNQ